METRLDIHRDGGRACIGRVRARRHVPGARRTYALILLAALATMAAACGDSGTEPDVQRITREDSLLVASLAGTYSYADTISAEWRENGRRERVMSVRHGTMTAQVSAALTVQLTRLGVDSTWFDTTATVSFVSVDSFPAFLWLLEDTLSALGGTASVPKTAVADSGVHFVTTELTNPDCRIWRMLWVPPQATGLQCRVAVHWRRQPQPARRAEAGVAIAPLRGSSGA